MDLFLRAVDKHVPQISIKGNNARPWIDKDLIRTLREKDKLRKSAKESGQQKDFDNYNNIRKEAKLMLGNKYKQYLNDIKSSLKDNPKTFWSFVRANTKSSSHPQFLKYGSAFSPCSMEKSNMFNNFFHSVFTQDYSPMVMTEHDLQSYSESLLNEIILTVDEVRTCLLELDPAKAVGPDKIPGRILKSTANEIAPSVCQLFNLSESWLPVIPGVPQGSILGPVLFTIFINDMPNQLANSSEIALYADDSKMARVISNKDDEVYLQHDLTNVYDWSLGCNLHFNIEKC